MPESGWSTIIFALCATSAPLPFSPENIIVQCPERSDPASSALSIVKIGSSAWLNVITSGDLVAGKDIYISDDGFLTGLWRVKYLDMVSGPYDNDIFLAPAQGRNAAHLSMRGGQLNEILIALSGATALVHLRTESLYSEQEEFHIPIARYQALALVDYIKSRVAGENADIKTQVYYEAEFRKKLERHDSAKISGPRMVSPGPFALK